MKDKKDITSTIIIEPMNELTSYQISKMRSTVKVLPSETNDSPSMFVPPVPRTSFDNATVDPMSPLQYNGLKIEQLRDLGQITRPMNDLDKTAMVLQKQLKNLPSLQRLRQAGQAIKNMYGQKKGY